MFDNFNHALKLVLKHEGGYVDHPKDPGGATNLGITQKVLSAFRERKVSKEEVRNLSVVDAGLIYKRNYWDRCYADALPSGVDYCVFDYAVNSGVSRSAKNLQRIVGAKVDGVVGLGTVKAVKDYNNAPKIISIMCDRRLSFMHRLRIWATFGKGWTKRVNGVREEALLMSGFEYSDVNSSCDAEVKTTRSIKEIAISLGLWGL